MYYWGSFCLRPWQASSLLGASWAMSSMTWPITTCTLAHHTRAPTCTTWRPTTSSITSSTRSQVRLGLPALFLLYWFDLVADSALRVGLCSENGTYRRLICTGSYAERNEQGNQYMERLSQTVINVMHTIKQESIGLGNGGTPFKPSILEAGAGRSLWVRPV